MGKGFLLDTHALIWATYEPAKLSLAARSLLEKDDNEIFVSAVSAYEVSYKFRLGKLDLAAPLALDFEGEVAKDSYRPLPLRPIHAQRAGLLAIDHRDPFDRMLIAQALVEDLVLVSNEAIFDASGVARLW
jgi:PIN domain nuclease of toxin-antitoxin system